MIGSSCYENDDRVDVIGKTDILRSPIKTARPLRRLNSLSWVTSHVTNYTFARPSQNNQQNEIGCIYIDGTVVARAS